MNKPDFSDWTLHELMFAPWNDTKTLEGRDFWWDCFWKLPGTREMMERSGGITERVHEFSQRFWLEKS